MALSIQLPTITQALGKLYPMKIYASDKKMLPCDIMELTESRNFGVAKMPLDNGTFAGDNIYKEPLSVSVRVFIRTPNLEIFINKLESSQVAEEGFVLNGLDGQIYENMRLESYSASQTAEVAGGYFYSLQFTEMLLVQGLNNAIPLSKAQQASYASQQDIGEATSNKKTALLKLGQKVVGA